MADDDSDYANWVRSLPCGAPGCVVEPAGVIHHHTHRRGLGQRASDRDGMPLCYLCHDRFHTGSGFAKGWDRRQRLEFQDELVKQTREHWELLHNTEVF